MAATTFQAVLSLSGYGSLVQVPLGRGQNHAAQTPNLSPRAFHYPHSCSRARESMRTTLKEKGTQLWIIDSLMEFISDINSDQMSWFNNLQTTIRFSEVSQPGCWANPDMLEVRW